MKKSVIVVAIVLFATSMFGIEPGELVKLYRAALTNDAASREFTELSTKHMDLITEAVSRMNGLELILMSPRVDSVSVTQTSMIITFRNIIEKRDALILTPDKEASIAEHHGGLFFAPVLFKNKGQGFQIRDSFTHMAFERRNVAYIALNDKPTEVSEKDVEMIMKNGEWKTAEEYYAIVEHANRLQDLRLKYNDKRREAEELFQGEELTNRLSELEQETKLEKDKIESGVPSGESTATSEPSEAKSKANRLWLYALIPLGLLAILCFLRKKRK